VFPDRLKHAKVFPLCKKGTKSYIGNYRPLSQLSVFFFKNSRKGFLEFRNLFPESQHGHMPNRNTSTVLNEMLRKTVQSFEHDSVSILSTNAVL